MAPRNRSPALTLARPQAQAPNASEASCMFAEHVVAKGVDLFTLICELDLEGIVAKHKAGPYTATPVTWLKILNPDYTQKRGRREMFDRFRERQHVPP